MVDDFLLSSHPLRERIILEVIAISYSYLQKMHSLRPALLYAWHQKDGVVYIWRIHKRKSQRRPWAAQLHSFLEALKGTGFVKVYFGLE